MHVLIAFCQGAKFFVFYYAIPKQNRKENISNIYDSLIHSIVYSNVKFVI